MSKNLRKLLDDLYDDVFTTWLSRRPWSAGLPRRREGGAARQRAGATLVPRAQSFAEYIDSLNAFFVPATLSRLKNLLKVFFYDMEGERAEEWKPVPTRDTLASLFFAVR